MAFPRRQIFFSIVILAVMAALYLRREEPPSTATSAETPTPSAAMPVAREPQNAEPAGDTSAPAVAVSTARGREMTPPEPAASAKIRVLAQSQALRRAGQPVKNHKFLEIRELTGRRANGQIIFQDNPSGESALTHFDGENLPVVQRPNSYKLGVVTGQILVKFKSYPESIQRFAEEHDLVVAGEKSHLKLAFFRPRHLPADLLSYVEDLRASRAVNKAELTVDFGGPHPL